MTLHWLFPQARMICIPFITWFLHKSYSFRMDWKVRTFMNWVCLFSSILFLNGVMVLHGPLISPLPGLLYAPIPETQVPEPFTQIASLTFLQGASSLILWGNPASAYLSFIFVFSKIQVTLTFIHSLNHNLMYNYTMKPYVMTNFNILYVNKQYYKVK